MTDFRFRVFFNKKFCLDENGYIVSNTKNNEETSKSQQQQQQWTNSSNKPDILLQQSSSTSAQVTPSPSDPSSLSYRNFQVSFFCIIFKFLCMIEFPP